MPRPPRPVTKARVIEHTFSPRGAAQQLFSCRDAEVLIAGPAGTGKSLAALNKLNAVALKYPHMKGLICRKTQASLTSSALATWRKLVIPKLIETGYVYFYGGGPEDPPQYRYANGSAINIGGMDKSSKIMSTEYDMVFVQEATELTEEDWESITTRLRNWVMPYQQLIADCNPAQPTHWLHLRTQTGRTTELLSRHEDNPALFDDEGRVTEQGRIYIEKLDNLSGVRYLRLRKGIWAAAEGVIYDTWDDNLHLIDPFTIPAEWQRYMAIDFGFTNPTVIQWWAVDPDGRLYLYREIYKTKTLVEDHARAMLNIVNPKKRKKWQETEPVAIICDHDAEGRATFERHTGRSTVAAKKDVKEGIEAVKSRLKIASDGKPRIFIMRGCTVERDLDLDDAKKPASTYEEVSGYVWASGKHNEEPLKENDHGCDAMRYVVSQLDLVGRPSIRSFSMRGPRRGSTRSALS